MTSLHRTLAPAFALAAAVFLSGCGTIGETLYPTPQVELAPMPAPAVPLPVGPNGTYMAGTAGAVAPTPQAPGSIFQAAAYRPLFETHRARIPGDILTVQITEKLAASQKSTSSVDKTGNTSSEIAALPFAKATSLAKLGVGATSNNSSAGKGATENSNDFSGVITAVVTGVLPNGHLLIAGEKQLGVNFNVDVLRFSGQVDPRSIQPGNVVQSAQIANVRLEQRGRGAQADAQAQGWLSRYFLNLMPF